MSDFSYEGEYSVRAPDIYLTSITPTLPPEASQICISAVGGGSTLQNGSLELSASGQVFLQAGSASMGLTARQVGGQISIFNGSPGSIVLAQSELPGGPMIVLDDSPPAVDVTVGVEGVGSAIQVEATGMKLSFGAPETGASIEMGPAGLTIQYGLWKIALTPAGIEMSVGPNKIALQPEKIALDGTVVEVAALTDLKLEALKLDQSGALEQQTQALITKVG